MKPGFFDKSELGKRLLIFKKEFIWIGVFSLIANVLMLTPTFYMLQIYDRVLHSRSELTLIVVTVFLIVFFAVMAFSEWLRSRLLVRVGVKLDEALNSPVFNTSFEAFLKRAGKNPVEAFSDLTGIRQFLAGNGIIAFFDIPWTPVYIGVIFLLHPFLGMLSIFFACVQVLLTWVSHRVTVSGIECAAKAGRDSNAYVQSKLRNIEPVHAMGMVGNLEKHWMTFHEEALEKNESSQHKQHQLQAFTKFVRYTMQSLTLGAGALLVIEGKMSTGGMIAANVLMSRALQPLDILVATWKQFIQTKMSYERLDQLMDEFPERPKGISHGAPVGDVRLEGLQATVQGRQEPILHGLDAVFPAGSVIAVIGPSGSGKSTLARCLVGVWPEVSGKVLIGDKPIESWDRNELGRYIGYLPQDVELFEGSIAENIARFSCINAEKVIEAATRTGIHDIILRFPKGYDTDIGEAGSLLSGGQRQRIGLARAMYDNPALIVLDEPNANLDDAGDRALLQAVLDLKQKGATVFLISHRMNVLSVADEIFAMQNGRIAHYGKTEEVLASLRKAPVNPKMSLA